MDPQLPKQDQPAKPAEKRDPEKDAEYAKTLLQNLNARMEIDRTNVPKQRIISTTKIIFLVVSAIIIVVALLAIPPLLESNKASELKEKSQLPGGVNSVEDEQK